MKIQILLLSLGMLCCVNGFAQNNVNIRYRNVEEKNDSVKVTLRLRINKIKSNDKLTITPILYNGSDSLAIHRIVMTGRNRDISDQRMGVALKPIVIAKERDDLEYRSIVPYESWMSDVSLRIESKVESCCTERILASQELISNKPIRYDVVLPQIELIKPELSPIEKMDIELPFLTPMSEYAAFEKHTDVMRAEGALIVRFQQGKNIIDPSFEENAKSLEQVRKVLELINADPNVSVGKIVLVGTSSPEGFAHLNDLLAQKRVAALKNYLKDQMGADISLTESITIGEDWVGLRKMVEQSDMQYKDEALEIINSVPVMQGLEKQLMDLKWGRPYNYMLENFFPKLRSAGYIRIFYETKPSQEFATTNEAIDMYNNKEYRDALARLDGVTSTATTENIRGVCYMMLGEYDRAETALNSAIELGNTQATENLNQLTKLKAVGH